MKGRVDRGGGGMNFPLFIASTSHSHLAICFFHYKILPNFSQFQTTWESCFWSSLLLLHIELLFLTTSPPPPTSRHTHTHTHIKQLKIYEYCQYVSQTECKLKRQVRWAKVILVACQRSYFVFQPGKSWYFPHLPAIIYIPKSLTGLNSCWELNSCHLFSSILAAMFLVVHYC